MNQQMSDQELQELIRRQISSVPSPFVQLPQVPAAGGMPRMINPSMVTDWTQQPYTMPAPVGSYNPFALRGTGLLPVIAGTVPVSNVPLYPRAWELAQAAASSGDGGGGGFSFGDRTGMGIFSTFGGFGMGGPNYFDAGGGNGDNNPGPDAFGGLNGMAGDPSGMGAAGGGVYA
jgi:hypothetical protein